MADFSVQSSSAHFDSVFEGPNGDYPAVLESLADVTAKQAMWKPAQDCNSIWQIVEHLTASIEWQLQVLERGSAISPPWVEPAGGEGAWQESLGRMKDAHARLRAAISKLSDREMLAVPTGESQTQLVLLLSTAAHEAHHGGQIDYLRGLQAAQHGGSS
jgi:uncharacterized damage-inducible protein DinB